MENRRPMHRHITTAAALTIATFITACGGTSPAAPSSDTAAGSTATISGSLRSGSPLLAATTGAAAPGVVVSVMGTAISSGIDAADRFTLTGVPAGDVQ